MLLRIVNVDFISLFLLIRLIPHIILKIFWLFGNVCNEYIKYVNSGKCQLDNCQLVNKQMDNDCDKNCVSFKT